MSVADTVGWYQVQLEHNICIVGQALTTLVTTGSISAALVIAVDQYCAVMTPLHYHRRITKTRAWLLLAAQWLLAVAMATFSFVDSSGKQFWKGCTSVVSHVAAPVTDDDLSRVTTPPHWPCSSWSNPISILNLRRWPIPILIPTRRCWTTTTVPASTTSTTAATATRSVVHWWRLV